MESKPIVTYNGDKALFDNLHPTITRGLPRDPVEWRRSYGRAAKVVHLDATLVPFSVEALPKNIGKSLIGLPFFHTYWTDCDIDSYKSYVRDEINQWLSSLKTQGIFDWMIIWVNNEPPIKTKLLPRTSVIDKIKSDFCGKCPDRCIVLTEPFKPDSRSSESWSLMLIRMRQLILQSYNRNMSKYEENMRAQREKRNQPGWNFCQYFMMQEELSFVYEMLGLYEDALVQYDELDALFTQFVLNHAAGESTPWLAVFSQPCVKWEGLGLSMQMDMDKWNLIKENKASLLDFRGYLFSRQCALLLMLNRPWELAERSIPLLHNCIQEVQLLEIAMPPGSIACWVFVTCLEILNTCEMFSGSGQVENYSLCTANLWEYARIKLRELGELCGLMPDVVTTSEQLQLVVDLISGMGVSRLELKPDCSKLGPMAKLREALSSKESFMKHYFEMSELAMGTFKYIGRIRSARLIGRDLAAYYMKMGEMQKAESYLTEALKTYQQEGWKLLADRTRLDIAKCQKSDIIKYIKSCVLIAASSYLDTAVKIEYMDEFVQLSQETLEKPLFVRAEPIIAIGEIEIKTKSVVLGSDGVVSVQVKSLFPYSVKVDSISLSLYYISHDGLSDSDGLLKKKNTHMRQTSNTSTSSNNSVDFYVPPSPPVTTMDHSSVLDLQAQFSVAPDKVLPSSTLVCRNSHLVLRRVDSGSAYLYREREVVKEDYSLSAELMNVDLQPGTNDFELIAKVDTRGSYYLSQFSLKIGCVEFLKSKVSPGEFFDVTCDEPSLEIETPDSKDVLLGGIYHNIKVILEVGTNSLTKPVLSVTPSAGLLVDLPHNNDGYVLSMGDTCEPGTTLYAVIPVLAELNSQASSLMERELSVECSWDNSIMTTQMFTFHHPFKISYKLHTAPKKKFIQVLVESSCNTDFILDQPKLTLIDCVDIEATLLNKPNQTLTVNHDQSASYMWLLHFNTEERPPLSCDFQFSYHANDSKACQMCRYSFTLSNYKTLFTVNSSIENSRSESESCRVGSPCKMKVLVRKDCDNDFKQVCYKLTSHKNYWKIPDNNHGVISLEISEPMTTVEITPSITGYLPYPSVTLFKTDCKEKTESFHTGEVYNYTSALQVTVEPSTKSFTIEPIEEIE